MDPTHRQILFSEAEDDVSTDENPCASDASTAVHSDGPLVVHRPQVADKADELLGAVWHAVVRPVYEFQVMNQVCLTSLEIICFIFKIDFL